LVIIGTLLIQSMAGTRETRSSNGRKPLTVKVREKKKSQTIKNFFPFYRSCWDQRQMEKDN